MKVIVLLIVIITRTGEYEATSTVVTSCPEKEKFYQAMEKRQAYGEILGWSAVCTSFKVADMISSENAL